MIKNTFIFVSVIAIVYKKLHDGQVTMKSIRMISYDSECCPKCLKEQQNDEWIFEAYRTL